MATDCENLDFHVYTIAIREIKFKMTPISLKMNLCK